MAAKDYQICPALFNAYIAKVSKKNPNKMMTDDRRIITEDEILMLIDWYLDNELEENQTLSFESHRREGKRILLRFVDENKEK